MAKKKFQSTKRLTRRSISKRWWFVIACLLVILVIAALELTNTTHLFHSSVPKTKQITTAGTPSPTSTISNNTPTDTAPPPTEKTPSNSNGGNQGGAVDTKGQATVSTDPKNWVVSKSGNITVKQPLASSKLQTGVTLSGTAKVDQVQYRLIDDKLGVVSQGTLSVVNGSFSGALQFHSSATTGRLDVYSVDTQGVEINEIQIYVSF